MNLGVCIDVAKKKDKKAQAPKKAVVSRKEPAAAAKKAAPRRKPLASKPKADNGRSATPGIGFAGSVTMAEPTAEMPKSHLSAAELEDFKEILMMKRAQIMGDIQTLNKLHKNRTESSGDLSSVPFHPADAGSDTFEQDFTIGLMDNEQGLLREIEEALDRIAKGTYGICVATHKPISKARLQAKPWAKYCIEYARLLEQGRAPRLPNNYQ